MLGNFSIFMFMGAGKKCLKVVKSLLAAVLLTGSIKDYFMLHLFLAMIIPGVARGSEEAKASVLYAIEQLWKCEHKNIWFNDFLISSSQLIFSWFRAFPSSAALCISAIESVSNDAYLKRFALSFSHTLYFSFALQACKDFFRSPMGVRKKVFKLL